MLPLAKEAGEIMKDAMKSFINNNPRKATVVIDRGTLYTFAVGTNEDRWNKVDGMFNNVIESFIFLF